MVHHRRARLLAGLVTTLSGCFDPTLPPALPLGCVVDDDCALTRQVCSADGRCVDDNEPPAITLGVPAPLRASTTVTVEVSVAGAAVPPIVALDDVASGPRFSEASPGIFTLDVGAIAEGDYRVVASARDDAGNVVEAVAEEVVTIDHTPPTFDFGLVDPSPAAPGENILLTLSFSEPVAPPSAVSADGATIFIPLFDEGDFHVLEALAPETDGPFTVFVTDIVDLAGNTGGVASVEGGAVDAIGPALLSSSLATSTGRPVGDGLNASTDLEAVVAFSEQTSTVEVAVAGIRGDASATAPGTFRLPISQLRFDGEADVVVTAVDLFGNSATHVLEQVRIDTIPPASLGRSVSPAAPVAGDKVVLTLTASEPVRVVSADIVGGLTVVVPTDPSPLMTFVGTIALDERDLAVGPVGVRSVIVEDLIGNRATLDGGLVTVDPRTCAVGLHNNGEGVCVDEDECAPDFLLNAGACTPVDARLAAVDDDAATALPGSTVLATRSRDGAFSLQVTKPECDMFIAVEVEFATVGRWDGAVTFDDGVRVGPDELTVALRASPVFSASLSTIDGREQSFPMPSGTSAFPPFEGAREVIPPLTVGALPVGRYRMRLRFRDVGQTRDEQVAVRVSAPSALDWRLENLRVAALPVTDGISIACIEPSP